MVCSGSRVHCCPAWGHRLVWRHRCPLCLFRSFLLKTQLLLKMGLQPTLPKPLSGEEQPMSGLKLFFYKLRMKIKLVENKYEHYADWTAVSAKPAYNSSYQGRETIERVFNKEGISKKGVNYLCLQGLHLHDLVISHRPHLLMASHYELGFQHRNFKET